MKKFFFTFLLFILLVAFLVPQPAMGALVPCGNEDPPGSGKIPNPCTLSDFFVLIANVYNFIVWNIATPLATLMIVIGGILMLLSGGPGGANPITGAISPNLYSKAKTMIQMSVLAILLIWSSVLIIDTIFKAIGYKPATPWNVFP